MSIAILIDSLGSGGAQRQAVLLAIKLSNKIDVILLYYRNDSHMLHMLEGQDVKSFCIDPEGKKNRFGIVLEAVRYIKRNKIESVISFLDNPNKIGFLVKILCPDIRWIPSERNWTSNPDFSETIWRSVAYSFADKIVCNSYKQLDWVSTLSKKIKNKSIVIVNGVSDSFFVASSRNKKTVPIDRKFKFLTLGRLSYQKNPELLLESLQKLPAEILDKCEFSWYGEEDPDRKGVRSELNNLAKAKRLPIRFCPSIVDVISLYNNADVLILPSRFEGTPNVLLEAMAAGLPVIATSVVDNPKILDNGERGVLVESENPTELASAIHDCIIGRVNLAMKSKKAFDYVVDNCSAEAMALKFYKAAYEF